MECKFCKNNFSSLSSLNNHMKTAKYCLGKRGVEKDMFKCDKCSKPFTSKRWLESHEIKCGESIAKLKSRLVVLEKENSDQKQELIRQRNMYEEKIQQLQDKLENIAIHAVKRSTVTNNVSNKTQINNIIQKMEPVTQKHLIDHAPNLTIEHVQKGASGYAEYALEYPLKDRVVCVDYARRKIKFKDQDGNVITDPEMVKLAPMFFENIKKRSSELVYGLNNKEMDSSMFEQVAKLFNMNADVKNGSEGIKSEFFHDFIKHVCSGSVVE